MSHLKKCEGKTIESINDKDSIIIKCTDGTVIQIVGAIGIYDLNENKPK